MTNRRWTTAVCAEIMEVLCGNTHALASAIRPCAGQRFVYHVQLWGAMLVEY